MQVHGPPRIQGSFQLVFQSRGKCRYSFDFSSIKYHLSLTGKVQGKPIIEMPNVSIVGSTVTAAINLQDASDDSSSTVQAPPDVTDKESSSAIQAPPDVTDKESSSTIQPQPDASEGSSLPIQAPPDASEGSSLPIQAPQDRESSLAIQAPPDASGKESSSTIQAPPEVP